MENKKRTFWDVLLGALLSVMMVLAIGLITYYGMKDLTPIARLKGEWSDGVVTATLDRESGVLSFSGNGAVANTEEWLKMSWKDCASVRTLFFEKGITNVQEYEFEYDNSNGLPNLTRVLFEGNVGVIGRCAFSENANLTTVGFGGGCRFVDSYAFCECPSLTEADLPEGCRVGDGIFDDSPMEGREPQPPTPDEESKFDLELSEDDINP